MCVNCGYHHPMNAWERLDSILDEGSFREYDKEMVSLNPLEFPDYEEKLESDRKKTDLNEAVVTGEGTIDDMLVVVAVMDSRFRMGSMGSVVGEKLPVRLKRHTTYKFHLLSLLLRVVPVCKKDIKFNANGKTSVALKSIVMQEDYLFLL